MAKKQNRMVFGMRPVMEAVVSGLEVEKCLLKSGLQGPLFRELIDTLKKNHVPFQFVPTEKLNQITGKNHQGVIAYVSEVEYVEITRLIPSVYEKGEAPFILVLDQVSDVRNFGAIARTAECAGVHALLIPSRGSAMITPDAVKTSAGALHNLPVCRTSNLQDTLRFLADSGLKLTAATGEAEKVYHQADLTGPMALILGSEDRGIHPSVISMAHEQVRIPILGRISSLNVSVAAGVMCYEVLRQRSSVRE